MNLSSFERRSLFAGVGILIGLGVIASILLAIRYTRITDSLAVNLGKTVDLTNSTVWQAVNAELAQLESHLQKLARQNAFLHQESQTADLLSAFLKESSFAAVGIMTTPTTDSFLVLLDNQQPVVHKNQLDLQDQNVLNTWSEPYFSAALQDWVVAYSIQLKEGSGVLYGVIPLTFLKRPLFVAGFQASSYNLLTLADGTIITYQLAAVLPATSSIFDLLEINENEKALQAVKNAFADKHSSVISYKDTRIGQSVYLQTRRLRAVPWQLVTVLYPADLLKENMVPIRHTVLLLSLALLMTLCLIFFLCGLWAESFTAWWIVVTLICTACAAQLIFLWYLAINQPFEKHADYLMIADNTQLQAFIAAQNAKSFKMQSITPISTGVYIEEMLFSREASGLVPFVKMSGYIWQRYSKSAHDGLQKDFVLPDSFELEKELIHTRTTQTNEIYTWRFACKHYETVTLLTYPFDHRHVSLRIVHPELLDSVMVVPDFSSYEHINPQLLPGIGSTVSLSNWNIYSSFFYYRMIPYNATLGLTDTPSISARPQMCFSLICQRTAIGELMSYLILILMSAIILFILLLSFSKHAEYAELMGFTNLNILTVVSGLLFVLIISQISLRENLDISGVSYIESFYFIMYLLITGISIDSILFIFGRGGRLIQYQHNLIPKLAYWPLFFILSLIATVIAFY